MDRARNAGQAEAGNLDSFEGLMLRYQDMAFGYALSMLRDYHLAQDATQEALFIAYTNLPKLREPKAFPGWLRGITHHQCCRYLRVRHFDTVSLDEAIGVPEAATSLERRLEIAEGFHRVLAAFVHGESEGRGWYDEAGDVPHPTGAGALVCLPIDNPVDAASPAVLAASPLLDARTYLSSALGKAGIYPAVDPLLSTSRLLDPAIVGQEHYEVARGVRALLRRYRELQEGAPDGKPRSLTREDHTVVARARRVQRFCTQPFFVAESFTGRAGEYVSRADTVRGFKALLEGAYDSLPEDAFLWCGPIAQAADRARALPALPG